MYIYYRFSFSLDFCRAPCVLYFSTFKSNQNQSPMAESGKFVFEPPSDEETEHITDSKYEEEEEEEAEHEEAKESILNQRKVLKDGISQSRWDFSSYSKSVAEEHTEWGTTSIDYKIKEAHQEHLITTADDNYFDESAQFKSHHQEDHRPEDYVDEPPAFCDGNDKRSFFTQVEGVSYNACSFMELHLSRPLLRACQALGYSKPTPIQAACIPLVLTGRDICGSAITGSGKTAAFALPALERLLYRPKNRPAIRVLILTPTRELATQVHSMIAKLAEFVPDIRCCLVFGGVPLKDQEAALRSLPDIVVATPGRMIDLLRNSMSVHLDELAVLILDEADRLLELGFNDKLHELVKLCPKRRQTLLFSATMSVEVDDLVKLSLNKPLRLSADRSTKRPATLTEEVVRIRRISEGNQEAVLLALCSKTYTSKAIIFSGTKKTAHRLKILFGLVGLEAAEYHGDLPQAQREDALELFRRQSVDFLITTDIAARGLDIDCIQTVINFECPRDLISYVHRVGRTARAGREGYAVTFVTDNDRSLIKIIKRDGSRLRGRIVAEQSIIKWSQIIEQMEDRVSVILREERIEMELRKAEMVAKKVENMILHKDEIYSRPKRTWFTTEKEKKFVAKASKEALVNKKGSKIEKIISAEDVEKLRMTEKRKQEHEKNLPRKKRRKLEAARELLEDAKGEEKTKKEKSSRAISLVEVAAYHRRAKAVKAATKAVDAAGKIMKKCIKKSKNHPSQQITKSRTEEMQELFHHHMGEKKRLKRRTTFGVGKKNKSFKSKSRYNRRG